MEIIAKGTNYTIELHDNLITIKGLLMFSNKKVFELRKDTFKINKFKQAGKIFQGTLNFEVYKNNKKVSYRVSYKYEEQINFNNIVEILQYGKAEDGIILSAKGVNGLIELYNDKLKIKRDSNSFVVFWAHGLKGDKEVWLKHITAVQIKMPGTVSRGVLVKGMEHNGYIQFTIPGGIESKQGMMAAAGDENTVFFNKDQADTFETLRSLIIKNINGAIIEEKVGVKQDNTNDLDMLVKLAQLKDDGIITEEEFTQKKKQILGI